jgi:PAP_fibrillin
MYNSPLENQSYSNNPNGAEGRLNPVLPRPVQDRLERMGIIKVGGELANIRSTQAVDLKRQRVRNVVTFGIPSPGKAPRRASLTVDIDIEKDTVNKRRLNVKFQACRIVVPQSPIDFRIPLGLLGPTGWLDTNYVDDNVRITRGHKGSVFILKRPSA